MARKDFLCFEKSRKFVRSLGLKNKVEWYQYTKSGNKPDNIPSIPNEYYENEGWINWGDFLGTGTIATCKRTFVAFEEARKFVRSVGLKNKVEWYQYTQSGLLPDNIPNAPNEYYKNAGWISWGDFLGTGAVATYNRVFVSFEEARRFVRSLGLKSTNEWRQYTKSGNKPDNIPSDPSKNYKNDGWISWGDFLGTGTIAGRNRVFISFEEARKFVRSLGLRSKVEWYQYTKSGNKPDDIPSDPSKNYKNDGWISWGDFLGTGTIASRNRVFISFEEARKFVRSLGLKSTNEWYQYAKSGNKPDNIPSTPSKNYKNDGWISWGDFLGTGTIVSRLCFGCKRDTHEIGHYYMVNDELWSKHGVGEALLCMKCLQIRAGRQLTVNDFPKDIPINNDIYEYFALKDGSINTELTYKDLT